MSDTIVREKLTRLQMAAVLSGVIFAVAFIGAAVSYYIGFSEAEETLALPHPPGVFEIVMLATAIASAVFGIVAIRRYRKLANEHK
ncbi:formate hydrogenlyase subunit 3/multisubunit Na+/H+ antiporter MnhD subunit [Microbacterium testaceum]|uniref:hypothetical protein n=1 Tax=Microbacterium TaxID=33882 RepID=UPI001AE72CEF|nr:MULTISPECIES: hypothetical protein [Microbacterium]MDQ1112496.1 formate hydrogenlyase subunit 3/multisubunit Na+/H+ antiporter MnhD subunit [Microbacterium testaceum]MDR6096966.1 formate hydrogenlyase subunit 3/multisubunit Na+/H+ antiporter MnhD subunit [Microbacterium sp. SORGH_AS_0454]